MAVATSLNCVRQPTRPSKSSGCTPADRAWADDAAALGAAALDLGADDEPETDGDESRLGARAVLRRRTEG